MVSITDGTTLKTSIQKMALSLLPTIRQGITSTFMGISQEDGTNWDILLALAGNIFTTPDCQAVNII